MSAPIDNSTPETLIFEGNVDSKPYNVYRIYYFSIDAVFILPTIFGNILIVTAIAKFSSLRKSTSCILIANLAVSDLLVGGIVFPVNMLTLMHSYFIESVFACLLHHSLIYTVVGTSVMNFFLLSVERFNAIKNPLTHANVFTKARVFVAIGLIWVCMFAFGFLPVFGWHNVVDEDKFICGTTLLLSDLYTRVICSVIVFSLVVNGILFFLIVQVTLKVAATFSDIKLNSDYQERMRKDIRHTKMMLIVSGLFIVFWGPFCVMSLIPYPSDMIKFITSWLGSLGLVNSSLNWIVYGCRSKRFRIAFKAILTCRYHWANSEISNLST